MGDEIAVRTVLVQMHLLSTGLQRKLLQAVGVIGPQRCQGIGTYIDNAIEL